MKKRYGWFWWKMRLCLALSLYMPLGVDWWKHFTTGDVQGRWLELGVACIAGGCFWYMIDNVIDKASRMTPQPRST